MEWDNTQATGAQVRNKGAKSTSFFFFFFFNLKERNRTTNKPLVIVMIQDLVTLTNPPHLVLFPSVLQISVCLARTLPYETTVFLQS